ncbi:TIGR01244 family phosphatase [Billgrantia diversa]|uniref:TIGR01244 family sulfur transferase n=1 Tax=Halomonas sp. MCCC 1A13316 TaxID=2733487 RepID=UPI0018A5081B|nr:TIGR01244 family sulfur transferase [Halomonas sp. MCCC 1A13316]QOR38167.1 TIGR01244 family phosphatase [Halomonas sp. MCCC 1A13316]
MDVKPLDERLSVMAQPTEEDLERLAERGYRTVISNRPRGEDETQPDPERLRAKAEALGMRWKEIPVKPREYSQQDIDSFARALDDAPSPVVGFCRTGMRVAHLWALSKAPHYSLSELHALAEAAGYDLGPLREDLARQQA